MEQKTVQELSLRLRAAQQKCVSQLQGISEYQFHRSAGEGEWSAAEIVGHLCESPRHAMANVMRIAAEENPVVGRTEEDVQARLRAVADHSKDSLQVALQRLAEANDEVLRKTASLTDDQLQRTGQHRQWGVVSVEYILNRLVAHYEEHARQLGSVLG